MGRQVSDEGQDYQELHRLGHLLLKGKHTASFFNTKGEETPLSGAAGIQSILLMYEYAPGMFGH